MARVFSSPDRCVPFPHSLMPNIPRSHTHTQAQSLKARKKKAGKDKGKGRGRGKGKHAQHEEQASSTTLAEEEEGEEDGPEAGLLLEVELIFPEGVGSEGERVREGWLAFVKVGSVVRVWDCPCLGMHPGGWKCVFGMD